MFTMKVDTRKIKAKLAAIARRSPEARLGMVKETSRLTVARALVAAPRDTNRFRNGWAMAANDAGIGRFTVLTLNRASRSTQIEARLRNEVDWWARIVARYDTQGRHDRWRDKAQRRLDRAREEYARFFQADQGAVIAIGLFSSLGSKKGPRALFKVYGGAGSIDHNAKSTFVRLHNKEPHASLVERNTGLMRKSAAPFKGSGVAVVKGKYVQAIKAAADAVH